MSKPTAAAAAATDKIERELWTALIAAERATSTSRTPRGSVTRHARMAYRNGLLDAYAIVTGRDMAEIGEALAEALADAHERATAEA